jgi:hypothetical protein
MMIEYELIPGYEKACLVFVFRSSTTLFSSINNMNQ